MKLKKRFLALGLALTLALGCFTGCGTTDEDTSAAPVEEKSNIIAQAGGSITWPEGMDTSVTFGSQMSGDSLYLVFNGVQNRFSNYFTAAGDSLTITSYATAENENATDLYLVTLWKESSGGRQYVDNCTIEFRSGGDCSTATFTGLEPGMRYKVSIAYMSGTYQISGGLSISGVANADTLSDDGASGTNA